MVAFGAFKEACFGFISTASLLCPIISNSIVAFVAGDFYFRIDFDVFDYFNFFCDFGGFF